MTTTTRTADRSASPARPRTPATNEVVADLFVSRFRRLTPREIRVLILVVQDGLAYGAISDALGISRANVANTMQGMRRKLAVPRHMDLRSFIQSVPSLAALVEDDASVDIAVRSTQERRRQDLVRVTVDELQAVAVRARRRAATLEALPASRDDSEARNREARMARRVAEIVDAASAEVLREVRTGLPRSDQVVQAR